MTDEEMTTTTADKDNNNNSIADTSGILRLASSKSVSNLPDMTSALAAKVSVSHEEQSVPHLLAKVYDGMAEKFFRHGLNLEAVKATAQYFKICDTQGHVSPLHYSNFPYPLPDYAVRLGVVFFQHSNPPLAELVYAAAKEILGLLPPGTHIHLNEPSHYHITVFMTSQPHTLRPNPFTGDVVPSDCSPEELLTAAKPPADILQAEIDTMKTHVAETLPPSLSVHRLILADSGTLLLCNVDGTGRVAELRKKLSIAYSGAPPRQPTILHASIGRILSSDQLDSEVRGRVQEACDRWSERLTGMRFDPDAMYHVAEQRFTTVVGPVVKLPFKSAI